MSRYVDVDIKIEITGPVKGAITRVILAILAVGIKYNMFVETPDFYRVCLRLPYSVTMKYAAELKELAGNDIPTNDQSLCMHIVNLACMVDCSYREYKKGKEAGREIKGLYIFDKLGLQVSYGAYIFCLTLFKRHWSVNYEYMKEGTLGVYVTNPRVETLGFKIK